MIVVEKSAPFEFGNHPPPAIMVQIPFQETLACIMIGGKQHQTHFNLQQVTMVNLERS